jgi:hypothetical protein
MPSSTHTDLNAAASFGLGVGGVFGIAGTLVAETHLQASLWAIDSVALVVAAALLTVKFLRQGNDIVAAGFLVFAIGESVLLAGTAAGPEGSIPAFAAGVALWAAALALISIPRYFATGVRGTGAFAAVLFGVTAGRIYAGEALTPTASPLPFFAYLLLVLTFRGWIAALIAETRRKTEPAR